MFKHGDIVKFVADSSAHPEFNKYVHDGNDYNVLMTMSNGTHLILAFVHGVVPIDMLALSNSKSYTQPNPYGNILNKKPKNSTVTISTQNASVSPQISIPDPITEKEDTPITEKDLIEQRIKLRKFLHG